MVEVGLQAETYGKLPTEVLEVDDSLPPMTRFTVNQNVRVVTEQAKEEAMDDIQDGDSPASESEREELADEQDQRAKQADAMEEGGVNAPTPESQLQKLEG